MGVSRVQQVKRPHVIIGDQPAARGGGDGGDFFADLGGGLDANGPDSRANGAQRQAGLAAAIKHHFHLGPGIGFPGLGGQRAEPGRAAIGGGARGAHQADGCSSLDRRRQRAEGVIEVMDDDGWRSRHGFLPTTGAMSLLERPSVNWNHLKGVTLDQPWRGLSGCP